MAPSRWGNRRTFGPITIAHARVMSRRMVWKAADVTVSASYTTTRDTTPRNALMRFRRNDSAMSA